jgi:hypothetical protein
MISLLLQHTDNQAADVLPGRFLLHYFLCAVGVLMHEFIRNDDIAFGKQLIQQAGRPLGWLSTTIGVIARRDPAWPAAEPTQPKWEEEVGVQAAEPSGHLNWPGIPVQLQSLEEG